MGKKKHEDNDATLVHETAKKVKVEVVDLGEGELAPLACYFPAGKPPGGLQVETYQATTGARQNYTLVGRQETLDYVGSNAGVDYSGPQPCNYAVGLYDKSSGKLKLMPISGSRVVRMEARLHSLDYGRSDKDTQAAENREERLAQNKRLVDSFGSTRRRRQLNAREEGVVRTEKLASADALTQLIGKTAAEAAAQGLTKDEVMKMATEVRHIPPHHPQATKPLEAYRPNEVIPQAAVAGLDVGRLLTASESDEALQKLKEKMPHYIFDRIHLLRDPDRSTSKQRARLLAFLLALFQLHRSRPVLFADPEREGMAGLAKQMRMKPELLEELLVLFYNHSREGNKSKYEMPTIKKSLLLAYILVTALLIENGVMSHKQFDALKEELKVASPDLTARFREAGAVCTPTTFKVEDEDGYPAAAKSYNITLLSDPSHPNKTLQECFPAIKLGKGKK